MLNPSCVEILCYSIAYFWGTLIAPIPARRPKRPAECWSEKQSAKRGDMKQPRLADFGTGLAIGLTIAAAAWSVPVAAAPIIFEASGVDAAGILPTVTSFRSALGTLNPNNGFAFASGRREINWDAVPDSAADPNPFPGNFFASTT